MTIPEILELPYYQQSKYMDVLDNEYKDKTGRQVCRSCPSDISEMVSKLKQIYKMTNFELKEVAVMYKIEKGNSEIISNDIMTDEKALYFLRIKPERIELFSKYPENWKELIGLEEEVEKEVKEVKEVKAKPVKKATPNKKKPCTDCKKKITQK